MGKKNIEGTILNVNIVNVVDSLLLFLTACHICLNIDDQINSPSQNL